MLLDKGWATEELVVSSASLNDSLASVLRLSLFPVPCDKRFDFLKVNIPTTGRCGKLKVAIFMVALYQRFKIVFIKKFNEFSFQNLFISSNLVKCKPDVCIDCHECWRNFLNNLIFCFKLVTAGKEENSPTISISNKNNDDVWMEAFLYRS